MKYKIIADDKVVKTTGNLQKAEQIASSLWDSGRYERVVITDAKRGDELITYKWAEVVKI